MKVLWILSSPIGRMSELFSGSPTQSGTWVDATLACLTKTDDEIVVAIAAGHTDSRTVRDEDGTTYYGVSGVVPRRGRRARSSDRKKWRAVIEDFRPDLIQVWGTEFTNALDVMDAADDIPVVVNIQGLVKVIADHKYGDMRLTDLMSKVGFVDKIKCVGYYSRYLWLSRQRQYEAEIVRRSSGIITDSDWCSAQFSWMASSVPAYRYSMPVGDAFLSDQWGYERCSANRLFCIAGTGPYKGIHTLLEALALVKREVPDVRLMVPGTLSGNGSENPYVAYLRSLITEKSLSDNVHFCGILDSAAMADQMLQASIMVMPSCVENQSSTLWEAMYLGVPCISSVAGSAHEVIRHELNGMLYRYGESEVLAYYIVKLLKDSALARSIGGNAYESIRAVHPTENLGSALLHIYEAVLGTPLPKRLSRG